MNADLDLILEIGVNHNNDLETAKSLIYSAKRSGAKVVKFQTYTANKLAAKVSPSYWDLNEEETTSQIDLFKKYDSFTEKDYRVLFELCQELEIEFMSTCFDTEWVDKLDKFLLRYKVASADITNFQLLSHIAKKSKPIILSTGAATFAEIRSAIAVIRELSSSKITLLHCVLNYPTNGINASISRIGELRKEFGEFDTGYSDHTKPDESNLAIILARTLGATVVEKHFTLDKTQKGNDHYHAYDEEDVRSILVDIHKIDQMLKFEEGDFLKKQESARKFARRGLYANIDLKKGTVITDSDVQSLRPVPDGGIPANQIESVIGKRLITDVLCGDPISMKDISS